MSEANTNADGLPEESVVMRLTEGAVPENPACYADPSKHFGMAIERWNELTFGDADKLTPEELTEGWHWCLEFDGLLLHPLSPEMAFCKCFAHEHRSPTDGDSESA